MMPGIRRMEAEISQRRSVKNNPNLSANERRAVWDRLVVSIDEAATLDGLRGFDFLDGGDGNDIIFGFDGADFLIPTALNIDLCEPTL